MDEAVQHRFRMLDRRLQRRYNQVSSRLARQHDQALQRLLREFTPNPDSTISDNEALAREAIQRINRETIIRDSLGRIKQQGFCDSIIDVIAQESVNAGSRVESESLSLFVDSYSRELQKINRQAKKSQGFLRRIASWIGIGAVAITRTLGHQDLQNIHRGYLSFQSTRQAQGIAGTAISQLAADRHRSDFFFHRSLQRMGATYPIRAQIMNEFAVRMARGESIHSLARGIRNVTNSAYYRAKRTAKTECLRSSSMGAHLAACQAANEHGLRMRKKWHHTHGQDNPRLDHKEMQSEIRELNEPFSNGGQYPRDANLSAEESINCGCWVTYEVVI